MKSISKTAALLGGIALVAAVGFAERGQRPGECSQATPKGWNYEIKDGKRVPKGEPRDQCRRQLARGSPPGQVHDGQGKDRRGRI